MRNGYDIMLAKQVYHTACRISYRVSDISLKYTTKGNGGGFCVWKKGGGKAKTEKTGEKNQERKKIRRLFPHNILYQGRKIRQILLHTARAIFFKKHHMLCWQQEFKHC